MIAIIFASLVPVGLRPSIGLAKPLEHGIAYSALTLVLTVAGLAGWPAIVAIIALAGALELGQIFVPGRDANPMDFLGSTSGTLIGYGIGAVLMVFARRDVVRDRLAAACAPFRFEAIIAAVVAGVLAIAISVIVSPGAAGWLGAGLAVVMLTIAVIDGRFFLIPNSLNAAALLLGLLNAAVLGHGDIFVLGEAVLRAAVLAAAFFALRWGFARLRGRHGIGLGDVKLAAVAGIWLGWPMMPVAVEIAALSALFIYVLRRHVLRQQISGRLPFGLYFAPAIWLGWWLGLRG